MCQNSKKEPTKLPIFNFKGSDASKKVQEKIRLYLLDAANILEEPVTELTLKKAEQKIDLATTLFVQFQTVHKNLNQVLKLMEDSPD
ncbi:MAG: hypothetical protein OXI67_02195 [Candidatus Poribacteria bacterium]|nr:hypothetical protein [Candidatus Poribacteria bacterium]